MTSAVTIRRARSDDAGEILVLQRAAYLLDAQLHSDPMIAPLTETFDDISTAVRETVTLVAQVRHRIVGFARARVAGRTGRMERLAVAPDTQGQGIGTALLSAVEDELRESVDEILADEPDRGDARVRLYRQYGFTEVYRDLADDLTIHVFLQKAVTAALRVDQAATHPCGPGRSPR